MKHITEQCRQRAPHCKSEVLFVPQSGNNKRTERHCRAPCGQNWIERKALTEKTLSDQIHREFDIRQQRVRRMVCLMRLKPARMAAA